MTHMSEQFLTFALDEEVFGIEIESVKQILELPGITSLSLTSKAMLGGINLREQPLSYLICGPFSSNLPWMIALKGKASIRTTSS